MNTGVGPWNESVFEKVYRKFKKFIENLGIGIINYNMYLLEPKSMGSFRGLSLRRASSIAPWTVFRPIQKSQADFVCDGARRDCVWKPLQAETDIKYAPFQFQFFCSLLKMGSFVREEQKVSLHNMNKKRIYMQNAIFCPL